MRVEKMTEYEMQKILANHFEFRRNFCVPNAYWGLGLSYEADLVVISKAGYMTEIEIKVDKNDLIKDCLKYHNHNSRKIKYLFFAVPEYLKDMEGWIPDHAGFLVVKKIYSENKTGWRYIVQTIRKPETSKQVDPISESTWIRIGWLMQMRYWNNA